MNDDSVKKAVGEILAGGANGDLYDKVISRTEKNLIESTLKRTFGNQSIAAKILGINRNTLRSKIKKLNIDVKGYRI